VAVGKAVAVGSGVALGAGVGVGVAVGAEVGVAVGKGVAVGSGVALGAGVGVGADTGAQADNTRLTSKNTSNVRFIISRSPFGGQCHLTALSSAAVTFMAPCSNNFQKESLK